MVWAGALVLVTMSNGLCGYQAFFREAQRYSTRESILLLLISSEFLIYLFLQLVVDYLSMLHTQMDVWSPIWVIWILVSHYIQPSNWNLK